MGPRETSTSSQVPTVVLAAAVEPTAAAAACERLCAQLAADEPRIVLCDVACAPADAATVDALARLSLAARRHGCELRLLHATRELRELIAFIGLAEVLREP